MTHPMISLRYWSSPILHDSHIMLALFVYIDKVHSLYSLVLISQDFLFSCLHLCELAVGHPLVLPPSSPLLSPLLPLTVRT
jgi:hypothetical protein